MALVKKLRGITPKIGKDCYLAENATIIGDVVMGKECSVWFNAVLRGDVNSIRIGNRVNIQDGVVIHTLYKDSANPSVTEIGDNVSLGHNVIIHGAKIEANSLIGMGAVVLDNAVVGSGSIIAANSLVLSNTVVEPNSIYAGVPAKKVKEISPEQSKNIVERTANDYYMYSQWYSAEDSENVPEESVIEK